MYRRLSALFALGAAALAAAPPASAQNRIQALNFIGQDIIASGETFGGTVVGGLSGLTYDRANNRYFAIADDRSPAARFYTLTVDLSDGALNDGPAPTPRALNAGDVRFTAVTTLSRPDGTPFPNLSLDPEGIALRPGGSFFISSEGDKNNGFQPFVNEFDASGRQINALTVPGKFAVAPGTTQGIRNNLAFESLTLTPGGRLVTATENALFQDGPAAGVGVGSPARILVYDAAGNPAAEYLYSVDPVALPPNPANQFTTNGLVDLLALDETTFLAIERSFSVGAVGTPGNTGNTIKLYEISLDGATDISALNSIDGVPGITGVSKRLLLNLNDLGIAQDNIEGLAFGPLLPNGQQSLILVSDNNFSGTQFTQFAAFGVTVVPEPGTYALLGGLAAFGGLALRRRKK